MLKRGLVFLAEALKHLEEGTLNHYLDNLTEIELSAILTVSKSLEISAFLSFNDSFRMTQIINAIENR